MWGLDSVGHGCHAYHRWGRVDTSEEFALLIFGRACLSLFTRMNTDLSGEYWLGHRAGWRGMRGMRPQPQVGEDFPDDLGLVNEGDDSHRSPAPRTQKGIGLIDLLD